jgi:piezo-type mechanosensitive ion channel component 1/2
MTLVILIGTRLDIYSVIYSAWLAALFRRPRMKLGAVWRWLIIFICVFTPLQYLMCVGLPPGLCIGLCHIKCMAIGNLSR